jgi:hypothetical protein
VKLLAAVKALSARRRPSASVIIIRVGDLDMPPVSQDVQDFCDSMKPAVQTYTAAQVAAAMQGFISQADADKAKDAAVADAVSQVQQDHADEMAALKAALAAATGQAGG